MGHLNVLGILGHQRTEIRTRQGLLLGRFELTLIHFLSLLYHLDCSVYKLSMLSLETPDRPIWTVSPSHIGMGST